MAYADSNVPPALHIPIQRWGGDATTRYNWQLDGTNSGYDWYFMSGGSGVPSKGPDALESEAKSIRGTTLITIPIIAWIDSQTATSCSFPTPPYASQQSYNPYVTLPNGAQCGNSLGSSGNQLSDTDITSNNTANSPAFQQQWVQHLVDKFGNAAHGGVAVYEMDNEPSGWSNTHRDVHPTQTGWDELVDDTESYAAAVKSADPTAQVDGPGDFGFPALVDMGPPGDNRASHGGEIWEAQYYLQQLAAYQKQHGVRLLDYLDEHYYPTTPSGVDGCIALCAAGDANTQAARLQSTRSLWDPTYVENDWIGQSYGATNYLGRMQSYVNQYYPGTKLAVSEYNFGGLESINGALTEADVLGIFGQENVGLASLWAPPSLTEPGAFSFAMYRNYDRKGDGFGDTSVQATSSLRNNLAVYAATRSTDGALTVMVINKTANALVSPLSIKDFSAGNDAQVWTYGSADLTAIHQQTDQPVVNGRISMTYPANSITLLVVPKAPACASAVGSSLGSAAGIATTRVAGCPGYWVVDAAGRVSAFGAAKVLGDLSGVHLDAPIISITATADGGGYWLLGSDGGVFSFGDAVFHGSTGGWRLNAPVVSMAVTSDDRGYWIVAKDGGVFSFGDAIFHGSTGGMKLNQPVDGIAVAPGGDGYWLVASDGGVFTFTPDGFYGSLGSRRLDKPIIGMSSTGDGRGYTLVGSDGGVFNFGDSRFFGSLGSDPPASSVVALSPTPGDGGYLLVDARGQVFAFGDASYFGSAD